MTQLHAAATRDAERDFATDVDGEFAEGGSSDYVGWWRDRVRIIRAGSGLPPAMRAFIACGCDEDKLVASWGIEPKTRMFGKLMVEYSKIYCAAIEMILVRSGKTTKQ